jgi:uncharacterized damage-inducible protein DinB
MSPVSGASTDVKMITRLLKPVEGFACCEAASFVAQLDDQSHRLREDLEGITPEELQWQPAPGMNTIGMLLAHLAVVEVHWMNVGVLGLEPGKVSETLGIVESADGIPLAPDATPPGGLSGKTFEWFQSLEQKARDYTYATLKPLAENAMDVETRRFVKSHNVRVHNNARWVLYHVLEHYAGHYGQILMMRHQYRAAH